MHVIFCLRLFMCMADWREGSQHYPLVQRASLPGHTLEHAVRRSCFTARTLCNAHVHSQRCARCQSPRTAGAAGFPNHASRTVLTAGRSYTRATRPPASDAGILQNRQSLMAAPFAILCSRTTPAFFAHKQAACARPRCVVTLSVLAPAQSCIKIWDLESKSIVDELRPEWPTMSKKATVPYCTSVAWSADGATLYTGAPLHRPTPPHPTPPFVAGESTLPPPSGHNMRRPSLHKCVGRRLH